MHTRDTLEEAIRGQLEGGWGHTEGAVVMAIEFVLRVDGPSSTFPLPLYPKHLLFF